MARKLLCIQQVFFVNNRSMAKIVDYISGTFIIALVLFVFCISATHNLAISLIVAISLSIACTFSIGYVSAKKSKPYSVDRFELELCMRENEYAINLLLSVIKNGKFENTRSYILLKNSLIVANFKFSALSYADINSALQIAVKHGKKKIYMLAKSIDRKAYQLANIQQSDIELVKTKALYKFLQKNNALPNLKKQKVKLNLKQLIEIILSRHNLKSYLFSGTILVAVSFLTPLKVYYLTFGTILLMLALLSITPLGNGQITSQKVFDQLQKELEDE